MSAYYNENDAYAAQWLRNLIAARTLPSGMVDERSIADVDPGDLRGYRSRHFFAGIGGWPYALDLAGWPGDRPVWTGSCPCQPFSSAGKQGGSADERHLWPQWLRLIAECRPDTILGEQVAGAVGFGWLDRVFADLEALGYACGAAVLGAHSVGAPHIRQRLFWVAQSDGAGCQSIGASRPYESVDARGAAGGMGDAGRVSSRWSANTSATGRSYDQLAGHGPTGGLADAADARCDDARQHDGGSPSLPARPVERGAAGGVAVSESGRSLGEEAPSRAGGWRTAEFSLGGADGRLGDAGEPGLEERRGNGRVPRITSGTPEGQAPVGANPWSNAVWLPCLDGKARRVEPGIFPLAAGLPLALDGRGPISRVGVLKGAGNSIVPQVAAEFIRAVLDFLT